MRNRALRYTIGFAIIGFILTVLITYVQRKDFNGYRQNFLYVKLTDNLKHRLASANLAFEQLIAGRGGRDFNRDVSNRINGIKNILQNIYDGKPTDLGEFEQPASEDTRALLKEAIHNADNLSEAAGIRWRFIADPTSVENAGLLREELDEKFNTAYQKLTATIDGLAVNIDKNIKEQSGILNNLSWMSLIFLGITFILVSVLIYRIQSSNEAVIASNEQKLTAQANAVEHISTFIEAVSAGDYNVHLELEGDSSNLTTKLITMRDKLKENTESDRRRGWATMGLAQIGEILRATTSSSTELFDNIIRFIVKYTKSNQGGLFILNEEDDKGKVFLDLIACYAFERKKFLTKHIAPGEGLVGQCFLEGERIYLLDVPQEYVAITSGLGGSRPKSLLIVPMKLNGKIFGVIELASFNVFEEYEIELIEKLAESVASTISTVRVNESTRILLEKNLQQAEEMKAQEEELHQNMEELEATQEEMRRKQTILEKELLQSQQQADSLKLQERRLTESQDTLQAIVDNIPRAIFWKDKDLYFMGCNKIFAEIAGVKSTADIIGKSDFDMAWSAQAEAYRKDDMEVMASRQAKLNIEEVNVNSDGAESWVQTSKVPIANKKNEIVAILGMFEDITDRKRKEVDIAQKLKEREDALKELANLKRQLEAKR